MICHTSTRNARPVSGGTTFISRPSSKGDFLTCFGLTFTTDACAALTGAAVAAATPGLGFSFIVVSMTALISVPSLAAAAKHAPADAWSLTPPSGLDLERGGVGFRVLAVPDGAVHQFGGTHHIFRNTGLGHHGRFLVQVDLVDRLGHGQVVRIFLEQVPATVLGHEPHAVRQVRKIDCTVVVELHVVRIIPGLAEAVLVAPHDALVDHVLAGVDVRLVGNHFRHLVLVGQRGVDPFAGVEDRRHHGATGVGILFDEVERGAQDFFGMVFPDVLGGGRGDADAVDNRAVAPRLAYAETV